MFGVVPRMIAWCCLYLSCKDGLGRSELLRVLSKLFPAEKSERIAETTSFIDKIYASTVNPTNIMTFSTFKIIFDKI